MLNPEREIRRRRSARRRGAWAAALALVAHGLFAALWAVSSALWPVPPPPPAPQPVALRSLTRDQWERNRRPEGRDAVADAADKKAEQEPEKTPDGQVVDVAPGNREESKDARYLAPTANKVDKETRAREQTAYYRNAMPQRTRQGPQTDGKDPVERMMVGGNGGRGQDREPQSEAGPQRLAMEIPSAQRRQEIRLRNEPGAGPDPTVSNRSESADVRGNSDHLLVRPGESSGGEHASLGNPGPPGLANLTPSPGALDHIAGAAPNDHLDVDEGDGTFLNTKEWKFSGFFNRVKQSVGMHWDPNTVLHTRDPTGHIYSGRDRFTLVQVTLDDRGGLKDISVEKSCGVDFLDLEAVHSF
ncbi:MAG TPA: energy transducer TonB, partial [Myxococcales bacterium]|nr:energy transducer TonB [Myxococcales bacterium]